MQSGKTRRKTTKESATFNSNNNHKCKGQSQEKSTHFKKCRDWRVEREGVRMTLYSICFMTNSDLRGGGAGKRDEIEEGGKEVEEMDSLGSLKGFFSFFFYYY